MLRPYKAALQPPLCEFIVGEEMYCYLEEIGNLNLGVEKLQEMFSAEIDRHCNGNDVALTNTAMDISIDYHLELLMRNPVELPEGEIITKISAPVNKLGSFVMRLAEAFGHMNIYSFALMPSARRRIL